MRKKRDFGVLLEKFGDGKARSPRRCRVGINPAIRLPSLAELLRIDAAAELAVADARWNDNDGTKNPTRPTSRFGTNYANIP